jgi:hypothetical protein
MYTYIHSLASRQLKELKNGLDEDEDENEKNK